MEDSRRFLFFDIDGTLTAEHETIPESCLKTIRALKKRGHMTALATGRNLERTLPFMRVTGMTDAVCDGGNVIVKDGKIVSSRPLEKQTAHQLIKELTEKEIPFALLCDTEEPFLHASRQMYGRRRKMEMEGFPVRIHPMDPLEGDVFKIFAEIHTGKEGMVASFDMRSLPRYVDDVLVVEPLGKHEGILELVRLYNMDISQAVVFGDEKNDIPMFLEIPLSVAMGNGCEELKNIAYYVTDAPEDDGIMKACLHFGWIREEDVSGV